jgi:cytochrome P450
MEAGTLPPGPPLPRALQTVGFLLLGPRFLEACRRRYGSAVTFSTIFDNRFVMLFDPALVKELFRGSHGQLRAGEANAMLGPVLGERSVLLLDGDEHLRHRRLMLPAFHGQRLAAYEQAIVAAADAEIDAWPLHEPFPLLGRMQALTLRVITQAVFGYEEGAAAYELRDALRAMIEPLARPRGLMVLMIAGRVAGRLAGHLAGRSRADQALAERFADARARVDRILFAEIARRRALPEPELAAREDVFSTLLLTREEGGDGAPALSDAEVRDELVTLLLAGHETTATGLAWAFDLLLHNPAVLRRARERDPQYLDAVAKEALRVRPVIPGVGRVVAREPFALNGWTIPPGIEINPSIRMIHWRHDLYPDPHEFRPERFLGDGAPDTYTWLPFGGGTRRCLGASFAQLEMRLVLDRVLSRVDLRAAERKPDRMQFRAITIAPRDGVRVVAVGRKAAA